MAETFQDQISEDQDWIKNVWFSDEAHFYLDNSVNNQNTRGCGARRKQQTLHSRKCRAWSAMSSKGILAEYG